MEVKVIDNSDEYKKKMNNAIIQALEKAGVVLETESKDELENSPRRIDTGNLRNSITHKVEDDTVIVGTNVNYALYVPRSRRYKTNVPESISA